MLYPCQLAKEVWIFAILSLSRKENAVEFKRAGCSIRSSGKEMRFTRLSNIATELDFQSALQEK